MADTQSIELRTRDISTTSVTTEHTSATDQLQSSPFALATDEVPEGGYGWVVVASCCIISFFCVGVAYSWGVIQGRLAAENLAPASTLAFIGSTAVACISFGAVLNARIIRLIGTRKAALLACITLGTGKILNGFATNSVPALWITNGIVVGWGCSLCFMATTTLPTQYFKSRRGLANGIVSAGGGIGGGVLSVSIEGLINRVGIPWTFRILGFVTLGATIPAAMLLKERTRRSASSIEWGLFKDPKFVLILLGSGIATFPALVPAFFIPQYATSLGISHQTASMLLAVFNVASAIGRVGFGLLGDIIGPLASLILTLVISSLSMLVIWPVSTSLAPLLVFIIFCGFANGGFFAIMPSVVGHMYGPSRVQAALAMVISGWAAGYFLGAPVAGYLLGRYGGSEAGRDAFRPAMYYAGSMFMGAAFFVAGVRRLMTPKILTFA